MAEEQEHESVSKFREFLRIRSVQPNPDYQSCMDWVKKQATEVGLEYHEVHFKPPPGFAVWLTWKGSDTSLKSINSHLDVVPVDLEKWSYDPFAAYKDDKGRIYARGAQDMKSVGVQHVEAVRRLKKQGFTPRRTVHITFVPDEEIGGTNGMAKFVETEEFANLNVGFGLDEAGPCLANSFLLSYGERALWQVKINITGDTGHALNFVENTAVGKLQKLMEGISQVREKEKLKLKKELEGSDLGLVTTLNVTMINVVGGLQPNVIPPEISVVVDIRVSPNEWTEAKAEEMIQEIIRKAGSGIKYQFINKNPLVPHTSMEESNVWWRCFKKSCDEMEIELLPFLCPGATDARFLRNKGIPAFGFSPMNNTPMLLHNHDEYLEEHVFLKGIDIFTKIVRDLTMLQDV